MPRTFREEGISFQYPDNWQLEREEMDSGWAVTVQSPETAFALVRYDRDMPTREDVAEATLEAFRADYPELDVEARVENVAGQLAVGHDLEFITLDATNTCWTRTLYTEKATLLILCQSTDHELHQHAPVLQAICTTLRIEEG